MFPALGLLDERFGNSFSVAYFLLSHAANYKYWLVDCRGRRPTIDHHVSIPKFSKAFCGGRSYLKNLQLANEFLYFSTTRL
jgi:hypothetical protein